MTHTDAYLTFDEQLEEENEVQSVRPELKFGRLIIQSDRSSATTARKTH